MDRLGAELKKMKSENIIEGPLNLEEPETFLSNLVITDKKIPIALESHLIVRLLIKLFTLLTNRYHLVNYDTK